MTIIERAITAGIIEPTGLKQLINEGCSGLKIIDGSFVLPGDDDPLARYEREHIAGAQFFDIKKIAHPDTDLPHMLPPPSIFEREVSALGITNDDFIVVYGQSGMIMGPARVWWTFKAFGHDKICVLNGGLPAWLAEGHSTDNLKIKPEMSDFKANYRSEMVKNIAQVSAAVNNQSALILDARPGARFSGESPEPRPGMRSGHIPGSKNLPCAMLTDPQSGKFKSKKEIEGLFENCGLTSGNPVITTCGSGVTACALALALYYIGYPDTPVYDGSWSEWGCDSSDTAVER